MPSAALEENLAGERSAAVRHLLAAPLLDALADRDEFRLVVRHAEWLTDYFEQTCGWVLTVDAAAGFARLAKRAVSTDTSRPLRRLRGDKGLKGQKPAFDRRRYEVLFCVCAELVRHPVTTIGLLASSVTAEAGLDTTNKYERSALVDALGVLARWGALRVTSGEVEAFVDSQRANAILTADTARLHRLLVSATAPSSLSAEVDVETAIELLGAEPRYGGVPDQDDPADDARNRWARHRLGRRLLDDPVTYIADLSAAEADYLASISGRRWLRERIAAAGFELEERSEGWLVVDPDAIASDVSFPSPQGNAYQLALLLADRLVRAEVDGTRRLARLDPAQLRAEVAAVFSRYPTWARGRRENDGPERLAAAAVDLLVGFGLASREADGSVVALPALARYRIAAMVVDGEPTLFEEFS